MRYTLSVLTAACLLALGQPAWAAQADDDVMQRARCAARALPDHARAHAAQLLQQLQQHTDVEAPPASRQRHLPLHPLFGAVQTLLAQQHGSAAAAHQLPMPMLTTHRNQPIEQGTAAPARLALDAAMVQRWIAPWQQDTSARV